MTVWFNTFTPENLWKSLYHNDFKVLIIYRYYFSRDTYIRLSEGAVRLREEEFLMLVFETRLYNLSYVHQLNLLRVEVDYEDIFINRTP